MKLTFCGNRPFTAHRGVPTASWATSTPTYPSDPSIDATWMLKTFLMLLSTPKLWRVGGRIFYHYLYSRVQNSFKRSQGPGGLSFLLKPAKGSAISLLKLTGHWVSHESRQQYASSTSLNQTIELVWATSFARSGSLQTTNGFIKFWPVWADTYNALPV